MLNRNSHLNINGGKRMGFNCEACKKIISAKQLSEFHGRLHNAPKTSVPRLCQNCLDKEICKEEIQEALQGP